MCPHISHKEQLHSVEGAVDANNSASKRSRSTTKTVKDTAVESFQSEQPEGTTQRLRIQRGKLGSATCGQGQPDEKNNQGTTFGTLQAVGSECSDGRHRIVNVEERNVRSKVEEPTVQGNVPGAVIVRPTGRKDRHSKVRTEKGLRDRRVRLSAPTAIQFFDVQDRLGFDQPSKAVDWLIKKAKPAIDELRTLPVAGSESSQEPNASSNMPASVLPASSMSAPPASFPSSTRPVTVGGKEGTASFPSSASPGTVVGRDAAGAGREIDASARPSGEIRGGAGHLEGGSGELKGGLGWLERGLGMVERGARAGDGSAGAGGAGEARGKGGWRAMARERARERAEGRERGEEKEKSSPPDHLPTPSSSSRTAPITHLLPLRPSPPPPPPSRSPLHHHPFLPDLILRPHPQPVPNSHSSSLLHPQLTMLPAPSLLGVISQSVVNGDQHAVNLHHSSPLSRHQPTLFSSPVVASQPSSQLSQQQQQNLSRQVFINERPVSSSHSSSTNIMLGASQAGPRPPLRPTLFSTRGPLQSTFYRASSPSLHPSSDQNLVLDYESGFHVMSPGRDIASSLENSISRISQRIQDFAEHEVDAHEESTPPSSSS